MAYAPTAGKIAKAQVVNGATTTTITGMNWNLAADGKVVDVSNFRDGRRKKATLDDASLSMDLVWDANDQPTKEAASNLRLGVEMTVKLFTDATHFFTAPFVVSTIGPKVDSLENVVMMPVTLGLNGDITYPIDT